MAVSDAKKYAGSAPSPGGSSATGEHRQVVHGVPQRPFLWVVPGTCKHSLLRKTRGDCRAIGGRRPARLSPMVLRGRAVGPPELSLPFRVIRRSAPGLTPSPLVRARVTSAKSRSNSDDRNGDDRAADHDPHFLCPPGTGSIYTKFAASWIADDT
jgi:hypothetical protein